MKFHRKQSSNFMRVDNVNLKLNIEFIRFRGFGKKILKAIDYDLDSKELKKILTKNLDEIY